MAPSRHRAKEGLMESRIEMSQHERDVLAVMNRVLLGERTQSEAAGLLHLSERQVRRIQRRLEAEGDGQWFIDCGGDRRIGSSAGNSASESWRSTRKSFRISVRRWPVRSWRSVV